MELYTYARLSDEQLERVRQFEAETGKKALVLKQVEAEPAMLSAPQVKALRALEHDLGHIVVVVE